MKNLNLAIRSLFKKGRSNGIKILALAVGLAMGLVLIAKVCFERSYDNFYPDNERIYMVLSGINREGSADTWGQVSGAIAPGLKAEVPEVECATRYTRISGEKETIVTPEKNNLRAKILLADTCFFDIFPRPILVGDPRDVLARPGYALISRSMAEKMGGVAEAVGKTFVRDVDRQHPITIGGVFEDVPENSHLRYDILGSLATMPEWSTTNWVGNDRYIAYVKLLPGTDAASLAPAIRRMQERNQDMEGLKEAGVDLFYTLTNLQNIHNENKEVKDMNAMLLFLALILISIAVLNYILVVISTLINRTKEVAVHKCYGASESNILGMILSETFLHLVLALLLSGLLIFTFQGVIEQLLAASLGALFTPSTLWVLLSVCLAVFLVTGLVPTWIFLRIPVASAFRNVRESRRYWKLCLLFVQFVATTYLVVLLLIIHKQYEKMTNTGTGYSYEQLLFCDTQGVSAEARQHALDQLRSLPEVASVSTCTQLPMYWPAGNNVGIPGDPRDLFNIADFYHVGEGYFETMEIPLVEGSAFTPGEANSDKVMVSKKFVGLMQKTAGWTGSIVGRAVMISEHSEQNQLFTICGIYDDVAMGTVKSPDTRASVMFYDQSPSDIILVKMHRIDADNIDKVSRLLIAAMPDKNVEVQVYKTELANLYTADKNFRNSIMISGIVTLVIALVGLLGYTTDETNRRGREIAIRKVNGATAADILRILSRDISYIAVPAIVIGLTIAWISGADWLEKFSERIPLAPFLFLTGALAVYAVIVGCVLFRAWNVANENPVESLKAE